ncbi:hypothetical protein E2C01_047390 [Portunus trituberculatus]|uniref:Uncharacterized protein n=1 Tax=Portunus trituberculatus TaxID=210409 RepID=A0A5B7G7R7_PORTR|nr:hypothetical protein [Portunus trituberculatus]
MARVSALDITPRRPSTLTACTETHEQKGPGVRELLHSPRERVCEGFWEDKLMSARERLSSYLFLRFQTIDAHPNVYLPARSSYSRPTRPTPLPLLSPHHLPLPQHYHRTPSQQREPHLKIGSVLGSLRTHSGREQGWARGGPTGRRSLQGAGHPSVTLTSPLLLGGSNLSRQAAGQHTTPAAAAADPREANGKVVWPPSIHV